MAELKTKATNASVGDFLKSVADTGRRADCKAIGKLMHAATGKRAKMWGSNIVGYGSYDYEYASGRSGTFMECGYSPRAQSLSIYIIPGFSQFKPLLAKLGKHKTGRSCLYIKRLADVDMGVLETLIRQSVLAVRKKHGGSD